MMSFCDSSEHLIPTLEPLFLTHRSPNNHHILHRN
jgi:hypothetical protein